MVEQRKRSASVASFSSAESEGEDDIRAESAAATAKASSSKLAPFESGAELHQALKTPSADLLRLLLARFRAQTSLTFAQDQERSLVSAADRRIELVKDYCQLCINDPSNSSSASSAANTLFSTWELADSQNLPTLLHLPIFSLAQALALLSIHYPTQSLGEAIIDRILSPDEPWLARLQTYISHLGGAKLASTKPRASSSKGSDVSALAALVLLREINTFARGKYAGKVFDSFNWGMKVLPHIFNMRRRSQHTRQKARKAQNKAVADASLRRPDIRTLYMLFLLSFLIQSYSSTLKIRLLELGRDFLPAMLKGLSQDPADVVQVVLVHLHEDLVKDEKISRSKKVEFFNEWACECFVKLYAREDDHVLLEVDAEVEGTPSVAELAHHFLLSICTNPGFGICYADRGWYPRKAAQDDSRLEEKQAAVADSLVQVDHAAVESSSHRKTQQGGSIHNKVLSGVLRQLSVTEDLRQQELALSILQACPELVGPYLDSSCAGLSVEPRSSSRWLCNIAFFGRVVGLELPSFRNGKVERLESISADTFPANPPPMQTMLSNLLPGPFHRFLFSQGLASSDKLVQYSTSTLLSSCLHRMAEFRAICEEAITQLDEGSEGPWRKRLQALEIEARKRLPDISVIIQMLQIATGQASRSGSRARASTVDTEDSVNASDAPNVLSTEVALRLLWLYYLTVPSSSHEIRFNAGRLLTNSFMASASDAKRTDSEDSEDGEVLDLRALCQVHTLRILSLSSDLVFDWTAKANLTASTGVSLSYFGLLLCLYVSTPLDQVKLACDALLRTLLSSSALFEHSAIEIDVWLSSLPQADRRSKDQELPSAASSNSEFGASQEQIQIISFIDECLLRCMKTPHRYIEASRQYLAQHDSREYASRPRQLTSSDMLASPLLMVLHEQFTIRAKKRLLDNTPDAASAILAYLSRLLPPLAAYTLNNSGLLAMAASIKDAVTASALTESHFAAEVMENRMLAVESTFEDHRATPPKIRNESDAFQDTDSPEKLRNILRSMSRPLSSDELAALYTAVKRLHVDGYASASEIFDELDPSTENLWSFARSDSDVVAERVPLLHMYAIQDDVSSSPPDSSATIVGGDTDQASLAPWGSNVHCRLLIWMAMSRVRKAAQRKGASGDDFGTQAHALLRYVVEDLDAFEQEEIKHYLFAEVASDTLELLERYDRDNEWFNIILQLVCGLTVELDPTIQSHCQMLNRIIPVVLHSDLWPPSPDQDSWNSSARIAALASLAPFMDEIMALQAADRLLTCAKMSLSHELTYLLRLLLSLFPGSSQLIRKLSKGIVPLVEKDLVAGDLGPLLHDLLALSDGLDDPISAAINDEEMASMLEGDLISKSGDGIFFELMQTGKEHVRSISLIYASKIGSGPEVAKKLLQNQPHTSNALIRGLARLENFNMNGPAQESEQWGQKMVQHVVDAALSMITSSKADDHKEVLTLVATTVYAVEFAEAQGWHEIGQSICISVLNHLAAVSPQSAFTEPVILLTTSFVNSMPRLTQLAAMTQKLVDQALLWLVRRFAEDDNDSEDLVRCITLFITLLRKVSTSDLSVHLLPHLVDPVVQAAIKNRLLAIPQLELVVLLCSQSELNNSSLSRYLGAISAHSDFNATMRGNSTVLLPLSADEDLADTDGAKHLQDVLVELIHTIAARDPKALLQPALMIKLMTLYGASLHKSDRRLLDLFRLFEQECGHPFMQLASRWSLPSSKLGGGVNSTTLLDALVSLDSNTVFATCTEYPRCLPLKRSTISGYADNDKDALPGQMYGKHADLTQRYDPVFLSSLLAGTISTQRLTGLEWLSVLATNVPGLVICGLSSRYANMRQTSFALLSQLCACVQESVFQEKEHLLMILDLVRDAALSGTSDNDRDVDDAGDTVTPVLPITTTLFVAHSLRSLASPSSFVYPAISHFMLQRPVLDVGDVPLLYGFLYSASDRYRQERVWMLRFLRDVSRSGGRSDWKIFKRRHTWELLASLYDSSTTTLDGGGSPERATEEAAVRALIEDIMFWLAKHPDIATELVTRRNILSWIWQQVVREGVMGSDAKSSMRNTWVLLVAQLLQHADLDRLDRATTCLWRSSALAIVNASVSAVEHVSHTTSSTTSIVYACALIMEKLIWHIVSASGVSSPHLLCGPMIDSVSTLLALSRRWVDTFDLRSNTAVEEQLTDARRCSKRVQNCILGLATFAPQSKQVRLSQMLRGSVEKCKVFDQETRALLLDAAYDTA